MQGWRLFCVGMVFANSDVPFDTNQQGPPSAWSGGVGQLLNLADDLRSVEQVTIRTTKASQPERPVLAPVSPRNIL